MPLRVLPSVKEIDNLVPNVIEPKFGIPETGFAVRPSLSIRRLKELFPLEEPGTTIPSEFLLGEMFSEVEHENIAATATTTQKPITIFFICVY